MTKLEARNYELENALESILDCFDDQAGTWHTEVETDQGDGYIIIVDKVTQPLAEALDKAVEVLYHEDDGQMELDFETEELPAV